MKKTGLSLSYLVDETVQRVFDAFSAFTGARIAFYDAHGAELRVGTPHRVGCAYCALLRSHFRQGPVCAALDDRRRREAAERGRMVAYRCHGGLHEAIMPLCLNGALSGFIMIGQIRTTDHLPSVWKRRAGTAHLSGKLVAAFARVPFVEKKRLESLLTLFDMLVRFIMSERLIRRQEPLLDEALRRMADAPEDAFSLSDAAALVHRAPSTVSHLFRKNFGTGFKRMQVTMRLDQAQALLRDDPALTVREAARAVGYDDPLYFSRLFRRHKGYPPSAVRKKTAD